MSLETLQMLVDVNGLCAFVFLKNTTRWQVVMYDRVWRRRYLSL